MLLIAPAQSLDPSSPIDCVMPSLVLGWGISAGITRLIRSSMLEVLNSEFVKLARAKGVGEMSVVFKHALRNALIPVVTFLGLTYGLILAGAIATETVFSWPGMGEVSGDSHHIIGTDRLGRNVLTRLIQGGRMSLTIALLSIVISAFMGTVLGLVAGYYGRWVDALLMRAVDLSLAFPAVLLALVFAVTFGPNFWWVVVVLVLIRWAHFARLVRGETLALKERDFVALSQVAGAPVYRIIGIHIFPNLVNSIVVMGKIYMSDPPMSVTIFSTKA